MIGSFGAVSGQSAFILRNAKSRRLDSIQGARGGFECRLPIGAMLEEGFDFRFVQLLARLGVSSRD
jgi:hypothetical protein